jgi:hypothetical protein
MSVGEVPLTSNPSRNVQLHCPRPTNIDRPLNEAAADKIRDYRAYYNNRPSNAISCMPAVVALLAASTVSLCAFYVCRLIGDRFFAASGVQLAQSNQFHYRRAAFYSQLKSKVGNILTKAAALHNNLFFF